MCLNIRYIPSKSRVFSLVYGDRYLLPCKCGKCAECQQQLHSEWYYRIYHEWLDTLEHSGWIFFDTLTYAPEYLPHMSEFFDIPIDKSVDFPCFCFEDVRLWKARLRRKLQYAGYSDGLRMFICSEYGTSEGYTHRPHYHVLFFNVDPSLDVDTLRQFVDDTWFFGRTDKVRKYGEHSNYFVSKNCHSELAVSNYVAKYVQKVSSFQKTIDMRVDLFLRQLYIDKFPELVIRKSYDNFDSPIYGRFAPRRVTDFDIDVNEDQYLSWCKSEAGKKEKRDILRLMNQFHRQSLGFGAAALKYLDPDKIIDDGFIVMPDKDKVVRKIPLPKYFERKLFERLVFINGFRFWLSTEKGLEYRRKKLLRTFDRLKDKFQCWFDDLHFHPDIDISMLARYVAFYKGRIDSPILRDTTIIERLNASDKVYNYTTSVDKSLFHSAFVSSQFVGFQNTYFEDHVDDSLPINVFIKKYVIDSDKKLAFNGFDKILRELDKLLFQRNKEKQAFFDEKQRLKNIEHQRRQQLSISFV